MVCGLPCIHILKASRHQALPPDSSLLSAQDTNLNISSLCLVIKKRQALRLGRKDGGDACERGDEDFLLGLEDSSSCCHP